MDEIKHLIIVQVVGLVVWMMKDVASLKTSVAVLKRDIDAAHELIRELKGKK